jgi:hypothetical protein
LTEDVVRLLYEPGDLRRREHYLGPVDEIRQDVDLANPRILGWMVS